MSDKRESDRKHPPESSYWVPGNKTGPGAIVDKEASYEEGLRQPGALDGEDKTKPVGMRHFATGATRNTDDGKYDYEGFLNPLVLERYAQYMHKNRYQKDGKYRDPDNWQQGMPVKEYTKSLVRHVMDAWKESRGYRTEGGLEDTLCAIIFNAMGILHERLRGYQELSNTLVQKFRPDDAERRCP